MQCRVVSAFILCAFAIVPPAAAAGLPDIKTGAGNAVPACVTPGRLTAFLQSRNSELNPRYLSLATEYMRYGEQLGLRWDFAFYQMILETGTLTYKRDVKPAQNNFAGLGATGGGEPGDSFSDIASGVQAHLQHLQLYAGERVDAPIAERTRKVQEWGVLTPWQRTFKRPITFSDLAAKWAPGSKSYVATLAALAEKFHEELCRKADPRPELVAEARGTRTKTAEAKPADARLAASAAPPATPPRATGTELARRAIEDGKVEENDRRLALGAGEAARSGGLPYKLLNPQPADAAEQAAAATALPPAAPPDSKPKTAAAATGALPRLPGKPPAAKPPVAEPPVAAGQKCRVWTASYGGQKAMIIRSIADKVVNFTVLDVNEGSEAREADAFISAYAKDGRIAGEFPSQSQALDKAFELCPEG